MKNTFLFLLISFATYGVAISQSRIVLIEQFTNAGCPPCAASSPAVYSYVNSNTDKVVAVAYHTSFPYNDSMYHENPTDANTRVAFYGVSSVPHSIVDGNYYRNASNRFVSKIDSLITVRDTATPRYEIDLNTLNLTAGQLNGSFKLTSNDAGNSSEDLTVHVVVIEKNVLKSAYAASPGANVETEYGYVMRKMFPDANGTTILHKSLGGVDTVPFSWNLNHIKEESELRVVVFVQNNSTKEIYQAKLFTPDNLPSSISDMKRDDEQSALIYPNPSTGKFNIKLSSDQNIESFEIVDLLGNIKYEQTFNEKTRESNVALNLPAGSYILIVNGFSSVSYRQLLIIK